MKELDDDDDDGDDERRDGTMTALLALERERARLDETLWSARISSGQTMARLMTPISK